MEKLFQRNSQPIAQFFNGGNRNAAIAAAHQVVHGGLGHTADGAQLIDGHAPCVAKLQNAFLYRLPYIHRRHLVSIQKNTCILLKRLTLLS